MQDLFKPSIWLEEDIPEPTSGTSSDANGSIPAPGIPPGEDGLVLMSKADPGPSTRLIKPSSWPEGEVVAVVGPPSHAMNW
jgi:hypothetical protein